MTRVLHLDFETFSSLDLKRAGVDNYVRAPDFRVTVIGWAFGGDPARSVEFPHTFALPQDVRDHIAGGGTVKAWNARFEWAVLACAFGLRIEPGQMDCVMERALAWGLPGKLLDAGEALGLGIVKDRAAHELMLQMGRPRKSGIGWHATPNDAETRARLAALSAYCRRDVEAERELDAVIPALPAFEREISVLTARSNGVGVGVDMAAVDALRAAGGYERGVLDAECSLLTGGMVTSPGTQSARLLEWLRGRGWTTIKDTTKESISEALASIPKSETDRRVLEIRQLAAKSSLAKLDAMKTWTSSDGRARNMFQFYGAGRTGRWAGRGPQPQNLPRPDKGLDVESVIGVARREPSGLGLFHGAPLRAIAGSLRGCLVAAPGHVLVSVDLSQIEARVTAWLAGQNDILDVFRRGEDVYTYAAAKIGSGDRQLGKVMTLGLGYGMGAPKFVETAASYGVTLGPMEAEGIVTAWREANSRIVWLWWAAAAAARRAIGARDGVGTGRVGNTSLGGGIHAVGAHLKLKKAGDTLVIRKPNGVKLFYHRPDVDKEDNFRFWGVDPKSATWMRLRTYGGKFVENAVQSVARDIIAEALRRSSVLPVMTVHDEIVWEVPINEAEAAGARLKAEMEIVPDWAAGLPVASEIKISRRYGK